MMREVLSNRGFTEEEISTLESREDYEALKLRVERLQADRLLDQLEARTEGRIETTAENLEERWDGFKNAISELEQGNVEAITLQDVTETLEETRIRLESEATERAETLVRERLSGIPLIGENIADWLVQAGKDFIANQDESIGAQIKNWLFTFIAGIFGVKSIFDTLQSDIEAAGNGVIESEDASVEIIDRPGYTETEGELALETTDTVEVVSENLEITNLSYNTGLNLLFHFAGNELPEGNTDIKFSIYNKIKDLSYNEVKDLQANPIAKSELLGDRSQDELYINMLDSILGAMLDAKTAEVLNLSIGGDKIQNILKPGGIENTNMFERIGRTRSLELLEKSVHGTFQISDLSIHEIGILYISSFPAYAYMGLGESFRIGESIISGSREELMEMYDGSIPLSIISAFGTNYNDTLSFGGSDKLRPDEDDRVRETIGLGLGENETLRLNDLIGFKNYILSDDFLGNTRLQLSPEMKTIFLQNLHYGRIIQLYDVLQGATIDDISSINFPLLILTVSQILGGQVGENLENSRLSAEYKGLFLGAGITSIFPSSDVSDTERRIYEIYGEPLVEAGFALYMENVYGVTGVIEGITGFSDETMLGMSATTAFAGRRLVSSAFPRSGGVLMGRASGGKLLMRAGGVGMLVYGGVLGYEWYNGMEEDGTGEGNDNYIGSVIDRDIEDANTIEQRGEILSRLQEYTHEYMIGDEKITIVAYPNDIPHAIYMGRIWKFEVLDSDHLSGDIAGYVADLARNIEGQEEIAEYEIWSDAGKLYAGETTRNAFVFEINNLFEPNQSAFGIQTARDVLGSISEDFPGSNGGEDHGDYIHLEDLPGDHGTFLALVAASIQVPES